MYGGHCVGKVVDKAKFLLSSCGYSRGRLGLSRVASRVSSWSSSQSVVLWVGSFPNPVQARLCGAS